MSYLSPTIEPVELTLQNIKNSVFSRRGGEEKTAVLGPGADEGASPEVHEGSSTSFAYRQEDRGLDPGAEGRFSLR